MRDRWTNAAIIRRRNEARRSGIWRSHLTTRPISVLRGRLARMHGSGEAAIQRQRMFPRHRRFGGRDELITAVGLGRIYTSYTREDRSTPTCHLADLSGTRHAPLHRACAARRCWLADRVPIGRGPRERFGSVAGDPRGATADTHSPNCTRRAVYLSYYLGRPGKEKPLLPAEVNLRDNRGLDGRGDRI
jgi:hypothetical protein